MDIKEQKEQPAQKKTQTQQIVEQLEQGVSEVLRVTSTSNIYR